MTSGLVLTQLKEGGRLGAYQHMLPYLFPLSIFSFIFHSQFSYHLSILPCDFNHEGLIQRCPNDAFDFKLFPFICPFLWKLERVFMRHRHLCMKRISFPSTHVPIWLKSMLQQQQTNKTVAGVLLVPAAATTLASGYVLQARSMPAIFLKDWKNPPLCMHSALDWDRRNSKGNMMLANSESKC